MIGGIVVVACWRSINVFGVKEAARLNILLAVVDFATQLLLVLLGIVLVFSPQTLIDNVHLGLAPTWKDFAIAIPVAMIAYTGIETISNMAEEARDEATTIPRAINRVVIAVFAIYALLPAVALSRAAGHAERRRRATRRCSACRRTRAASPATRCWGSSRTSTSAPLQGVGELYVGLLAATILFIATNAGIIGVSRLVYSMGIHRQVPDRLRQLHPQLPHAVAGDPDLLAAIACIAMIPGQAEFLGNMYAFGAMLSFTIAHAAVVRLRIKLPDQERPYRDRARCASPAATLPLFALVGGARDGARVGHRDGAAPRRRARRHRLARVRDRAVCRLPPPPWARPHDDDAGRRAEAGRRPRGRVRGGARRLRRATSSAATCSRPPPAWRPAAAAASTCS